MADRLHLATTRLEDAQQERVWAITAAQATGLSIRKIAAATGLSPSRIHQLLNNQEASEIPAWLNQLHEPKLQDSEEVTDQPPTHSLQARLTAEVEVLRWCIGWLERLESVEEVVVNLQPNTDAKTEFVRFDRPRVLRVLSRIVADLDELACGSNGTKSVDVVDNEEAQAKHRRQLAEPEPKPQRLSQREERDALREACGLPPYSSP